MVRSCSLSGSGQAREQRYVRYDSAFSFVANRHSPYSGISDEGCQNSFFFTVPASTEIYTLSLHDALPICASSRTTGPVTATRTPHCRDSPKGRCGRRSEEHTSELQSHLNLVCRLLLE